MARRGVVPVTRGEVWQGPIVLDGPFYWRRNDEDVWHLFELRQDPFTQHYVISEVATGTSLPFS